jgi:hypothetical protein
MQWCTRKGCDFWCSLMREGIEFFEAVFCVTVVDSACLRSAFVGEACLCSHALCVPFLRGFPANLQDFYLTILSGCSCRMRLVAC